MFKKFEAYSLKIIKFERKFSSPKIEIRSSIASSARFCCYCILLMYSQILDTLAREQFWLYLNIFGQLMLYSQVSFFFAMVCADSITPVSDFEGIRYFFTYTSAIHIRYANIQILGFEKFMQYDERRRGWNTSTWFDVFLQSDHSLLQLNYWVRIDFKKPKQRFFFLFFKLRTDLLQLHLCIYHEKNWQEWFTVVIVKALPNP